MKRLLTIVMVICLYLGLALFGKHVCLSFQEPDRKFHTYLKQQQVANDAVFRVLGSVQASDVDYAQVSAGARTEIERMRQLAYDPIKLADTAKLDEEIAIANDCDRDRSDPRAFNHCEEQLSYKIGH